MIHINDKLNAGSDRLTQEQIFGSGGWGRSYEWTVNWEARSDSGITTRAQCKFRCTFEKSIRQYFAKHWPHATITGVSCKR